MGYVSEHHVEESGLGCSHLGLDPLHLTFRLFHSTSRFLYDSTLARTLSLFPSMNTIPFYPHLLPRISFHAQPSRHSDSRLPASTCAADMSDQRPGNPQISKGPAADHTTTRLSLDATIKKIRLVGGEVRREAEEGDRHLSDKSNRCCKPGFVHSGRNPSATSESSRRIYKLTWMSRRQQPQLLVTTCKC
jgi:hypothetical protein